MMNILSTSRTCDTSSRFGVLRGHVLSIKMLPPVSTESALLGLLDKREEWEDPGLKSKNMLSTKASANVQVSKYQNAIPGRLKCFQSKVQMGPGRSAQRIDGIRRKGSNAKILAYGIWQSQ